MFSPDFIAKASTAVAVAVREVVSEMASGEVETEPSITERLVTSIKHSINKIEEGDVRLFARTLRDRGPGAPEKEFGADLCCVLRVRLKNYELSKGFLVQSKRPKTARWRNDLMTTGLEASVGDVLVGVRSNYLEMPNDGEFVRTQDQCGDMLQHTPSSFVFLYTKSGIHVTPALSVCAHVGDTAPVLDSKTLPVFFTDFFRCFVGDPRLTGWHDEDLRALKARTGSKNLLVLDAVPPQHRPPESGILD